MADPVSGNTLAVPRLACLPTLLHTGYANTAGQTAEDEIPWEPLQQIASVLTSTLTSRPCFLVPRTGCGTSLLLATQVAQSFFWTVPHQVWLLF